MAARSAARFWRDGFATKRDAQDATQTVQAKDAVLIDTTYLTQPEQVDRIVALARAVTHRGSETSPVDDHTT